MQNLSGFEIFMDAINNDVEEYKKDLEKSIFLTLKLINNQTNIEETIDFIGTDNPKSFLWKYWVRGDRKNSPQKNGFIFTCAFFDTFKAQGRNRAIISTDPNMPYSLKGLGILIEKLEIEKLLSSGESIEKLTENSRPGFHRADLWYDGRAPIHNYTIIDAPRAGSILSNDELIDIIGRYEYWNEIGQNISSFNNIYSLLNLPLLSNNEIETSYKNLDLNVLNELCIDKINIHINNITNTLQNLKYYSIKSNILEQKRTKFRNSVLDSFIEFINQIPDTEIHFWGDKLTDIIIKYLPNQYIISWIRSSYNLSTNSIIKILNKLIPTIEIKNYYPLLLDIQNNHFNSFNNLYRISKVSEIFTFDDTKKILVNLFLDFNLAVDIETEIINNIPIYAFDNIKNYFDDIFVAHSFKIKNKIDERLLKFIFNDFIKLSNIEINKDYIFYDEFEYFYKLYIEKEIFGENLKNFRDLKSKLLQSDSGKNFGYYKKISPDEYFNFSYSKINKCISYFKSKFTNNNADEILFINYLKIIKNKIAFQNLSDRINQYLRIKKLLKNNILTDYLNQYNKDLLLFTEFTNKLLHFVISYNYISTEKETQDSINELIEYLDKISLENNSLKNEFFELFLDKIYEFLNKISAECKIPISQNHEIIDLCLDQINTISNNETSLLGLIDKGLPKCFSLIYKDILNSQRRYYLRKIKFLQNTIKKLQDSEDITDNSQSNNSNPLAIANNILFNSVRFDWKGLKNFVDTYANNDLKELFYYKFFYWTLLYLLDKNLDNNLHKIHKINSEFRKSFGENNKDLNEAIKKLPFDNNWQGFLNHYSILVFEVEVEELIEDLNNYINNASYEYISDFFILKFDIENLSFSLENYSSNYPKYYKLITKTNFLRSIVLFLIFMLFGAAIFDTNKYPLNDSENNIEVLSPVSSLVETYIGSSFLNITSDIFKFFWLSILFIIFIAPFIYVIYQVPKFFKFNKDNVKKPKFLELIRKIEGKKYSLFYFQFITPLLMVLLNIASPDTVELLNNFTGFRFISILIIIIGLIFLSIYREIAIINTEKPTRWILSRTKHMFWLYYLQSLIITIFLIDLILRYQLNLDNLYLDTSDYFMYGLSKFIPYNISIPSIGFEFDIVIMPITTILISLLSLFFSFIIVKILGNKND